MQEEGTSLAKMAVGVLLVVLVIGAVVGLVYKAYSWYNSGADKLTSSVVSIDKSSYSQYDDTSVTGTDVLSALKTYRESDISICVANKAVQGTFTLTPADGTVMGAVPNYCALSVEAATATMGDPANTPAASLTYDEGQWKFMSGLQWDPATAQVARNTNFSPTTTNANTKCFVKQSGKWYANLIYDDTTGDICGILFRQQN